MDRTKRQALGIKKWQEGGCRGTALYPTGFGKTRTAITAIKRFLSKNPGKKILVVVPTDYLLEQWNLQLVEEQLFKNVIVKVINTVIKSNWEIDLLILDEIHTMAADTFFQVFLKVKYKLILGLTGTIDRLDGKEVLIKQKCPIIDSISMEEAIQNKWLSQYIEYKVMINVDNIDEYHQYSTDFMKYFAKFKFDFNLAMACVSGEKRGGRIIKKAHLVRHDYAKELCGLPPSHPNYKNEITNLFKEITANAFSWNKMLHGKNNFIKNHPKKIEIARKILEHRQDKKAITFSATIKAAEEIGIGYVLHSGKTKKKRGIVKDEFDKLEVGVLNTSKALDCGADIPGLNLGIILFNSSSSIQKRQRLGRVIRFSPDKVAELFTIIIKGTSEENWFNKSTGKMDYVTIDENQLDLVLNNKPLKTNEPQEFDFIL